MQHWMLQLRNGDHLGRAMSAGLAQRQGRSLPRRGSEPHQSASAAEATEDLSPDTPHLDMAGPGAAQDSHGLGGPRTMLSIIDSISPGSLANQRVAEGVHLGSHPLPDPVGRLPAVTRSLSAPSMPNEFPSMPHGNNSPLSAHGGHSHSVHSSHDAHLATSFGGHAGLGLGTLITAGERANTTGIVQP